MWLLRIFVLLCTVFSAFGLRTQMCDVFLNHYYLFQNQNPPEIYNITAPIDRTPLQATMDYSNPSYPKSYFSFPLPLTPSGRGTATLAYSANPNVVVDGYFVPVLQENPLLCSIISTHLDRCGRLWILDSGLLNLDTFKCAAKIVIIDKNSEEILDIYEFPPEYSHPASRLIKMVVDENFKKCRDFKAVISDAVQKHLIVYEPAKERSWIVTSPTFENQSIFENVQFQDITFSFPVGVYSVAFTPAYGKNRERCLVYTIFSGDSIYCVPTSILYDYSLWSNGFSTRKLVSKKKTSRFSKFFKNKKADVDIEFVNVQDFFYFIGKTDIQLVGTCGIDKNWLMYCGAEGGVTVMNLRKGSEGNSFIVRNDTMEYVSDVHVVRNPQGEEELFALNNSMLRILGKPFNSTNMNYGYYGCKISEMNAGDNVKCNPFICSIR